MSGLAPWAGDYIGLPFQARGRTRAGVDCWGVSRMPLNDIYGLNLPSHDEDYQDVRDTAKLEALIEREAGAWRKIGYCWRDAPLARVADIVRLRDDGHAGHLGLVVGMDSMLHVFEGAESRVSNYLLPKYKFRITGFYRHARLC